jgi:hypothetical protein
MKKITTNKLEYPSERKERERAALFEILKERRERRLTP